MATTTDPNAADLSRDLDAGFQAADASNRLVARHAFGIVRARHATRMIDAARAAARDDTAAEAARVAVDATVQELAITCGISERSYVEPLGAIDPHVAVLHGRVHSPTGEGVNGLVVRVTGADGRTRNETKTGARGYFRVDFGDRATRLPTIEAGATRNTPRVAVHVAVLDGVNELFVEKGSTLIRPGRSVYREFEVTRPPVR